MSAKKTVRHIQNNFRLTTKLLSDSNILPVSKVLLKNNFPTYELPLHNPNSRPRKRKANLDCPPCPPIEKDCPEMEYQGQSSRWQPTNNTQVKKVSFTISNFKIGDGISYKDKENPYGNGNGHVVAIIKDSLTVSKGKYFINIKPSDVTFKNQFTTVEDREYFNNTVIPEYQRYLKEKNKSNSNQNTRWSPKKSSNSNRHNRIM